MIELLAGARAGADPNREMAALYTELDGPLRRIVGFNVHAPEAVLEDACQVAWSRLLRRRNGLRREATLAWLVTTATREALRLVRRADRELPLEALPEGTPELRVAAPPDQVVQLRARLDGIGALPVRQQRLVWLQGLGFSYAEMSGCTGASLRSVERHLLRAKQALPSA